MPLTKKFTSAASANGLPGTDAKKNLAKIKEYRWRGKANCMIVSYPLFILFAYV